MKSDSIAKKYRKVKKLGEGTYAIVYKALQEGTNRPVAIKKIRSGVYEHGLDMSAIREITWLRELQHVNIVEQGTINLVVEFLLTDLEIVIKDKKLVFSPADVKSWLLMTLRGLNHCHRSWIIHRDLKPNNLLLASNGVLKIADFGLARFYGLPRGNMTPTVVTRWYRAPELLFGAQDYTSAVDMWAIGAIFAELMLRTPYIPGDSDLDQINKTFQALGTPNTEDWPNFDQLPEAISFVPQPRPSMQQLFTAASPEAINLLEKLMVYNPLNRITAEKALLHPYFTQLPRPTVPAKLPMPNMNIETTEDVNERWALEGQDRVIAGNKRKRQTSPDIVDTLQDSQPRKRLFRK